MKFSIAYCPDYDGYIFNEYDTEIDSKKLIKEALKNMVEHDGFIFQKIDVSELGEEFGSFYTKHENIKAKREVLKEKQREKEYYNTYVSKKPTKKQKEAQKIIDEIMGNK